MSFDDRLRSHLHAKGDTIEPVGVEPATLAAKARRRRTSTRLGALAVAGLAGFGAFVALNDPEGDEPLDDAIEVATVTPEVETAEAEVALDWVETTGPAIEWPQSIVGTDDGFIVVNVSYETDNPVIEVFESPDGSTWTQVDATTPDVDWWIDQVRYVDGAYVAQGTSWGEFDAAGETHLAVSADLQSWTTATLPAASGDAPDFAEVSVWVSDLAVNGDEIVVLGNESAWLDVYSLLPGDLRDDYDINYELVDGGVQLTRYIYTEVSDPSTLPLDENCVAEFSSEADTVEVPEELLDVPVGEICGIWPEPEMEDLGFFSWADLGVDGSLVDSYFDEWGGHESTVGWKSTDGGATYQPVTLTGFPEGGAATGESFGLVGLVAADDGYIAVANDWMTGQATVWFSSDGISWAQNEAASAAFGNSDVFSGIEHAGDALVIVGTCDGMPYAWRSTDGGTNWIGTNLSEVLGSTNAAGADPSQTGGGALGIATVMTIWPEFDVPDIAFDEFFPSEPFVYSRDGFTVELDLGSAFDDESGGVTVRLLDADGAVLVDDVIPFDATSPFETANLSMSADDDLTFLDADGNAIITVTDEEMEDAMTAWEAEFAPAEPAIEEFEGSEPFDYEPPTNYILFSPDGERWGATDLADIGIDAAAEVWVQSVVVSDDAILVVVDSYEYTDVPFEAEDCAADGCDQFFEPGIAGDSLRWFVGTPQ